MAVNLVDASGKELEQLKQTALYNFSFATGAGKADVTFEHKEQNTEPSTV